MGMRFLDLVNENRKREEARRKDKSTKRTIVAGMGLLALIVAGKRGN